MTDLLLSGVGVKCTVLSNILSLVKYLSVICQCTRSKISLQPSVNREVQDHVS